MPSTYALGKHYEDFVAGQLASGRYGDASDVIRDALHLLEERERRLAALDATIERGIASADAGRVTDADEVFDRLEAELAALPDPRHE